MLVLRPAAPSQAGDAAPPLTALQALEHDVQSLVASVSPSVVTIRSSCRGRGREAAVGARSLSIGSGVVIDTLGHILTTARVVQDADDFWVEARDGRVFQGVMMGASGEVAVLRVEGSGLPPAQFSDESGLTVGSLVAAVGNSYGYAGGLSWGEINGFRPDGTIQMSLGVPAGSSGGALVDTRGQVVGLIKAKLSEPYFLDPLILPLGEGRSPVSVPARRLELPTSSVSLAVPIGVALRSAARITESQAAAPPYLGVYLQDLTGWYTAHFKTDSGVLVTDIVANSPAQQYGVLRGDVVTAVDRQPVSTVRRLLQMVAQSEPGQRMALDLIRGGKPLRVTLVVGRGNIPTLDGASEPATAANPPPNGPPAPPFGLPVSMEAVDAPTDVNVRTAGHGVFAPHPDGADCERRCQRVERMIDSLQQELAILRRSIHP